MEEGKLMCNLRRCRRVLDGVAWVTFCSHIFCDEDGSQLFQVPNECKACGAKLTGKNDVVRVDLDPAEEFKSMILAGLKPEIVMEVCHRAINFWSYQVEQECNFQRHIVKRLRERQQEIQTYYEQQIRCQADQLETTKRQLDGCRQDIEKCREQKETLNEKLREKTRQYQRLQSMYDSLRKFTGSSVTDDWQTYRDAPVSTSSKLPLTSAEFMHLRNQASLLPLQPPPLPYLDLASSHPSMSSKNRHQHQSSGSGMEMVLSDRSVGHTSGCAFSSGGNPGHDVFQTKHHQVSSSDNPFHQLTVVPGKSNKPLPPPPCFQQSGSLPHHPQVPLPQTRYNLPSLPSTSNLSIPSLPLPVQEPSLECPQQLQVQSVPSSTYQTHHRHQPQEVPASHRQLDVPSKDTDSFNTLLPLKPIFYDDFVFAPILHNSRHSGRNNRRHSNSGSDSNREASKDTRHCV